MPTEGDEMFNGIDYDDKQDDESSDDGVGQSMANKSAFASGNSSASGGQSF